MRTLGPPWLSNCQPSVAPTAPLTRGELQSPVVWRRGCGAGGAWGREALWPSPGTLRLRGGVRRGPPSRSWLGFRRGESRLRPDALAEQQQQHLQTNEPRGAHREETRKPSGRGAPGVAGRVARERGGRSRADSTSAEGGCSLAPADGRGRLRPIGSGVVSFKAAARLRVLPLGNRSVGVGALAPSLGWGTAVQPRVLSLEN